MAEHYSFFNSVIDAEGNFDRPYLAEDFARYFSSFVGNGVFMNSGSALKVEADAGMAVRVTTGRAFINGYFYELDEAKTLPIDIADGSLSRIDLVVLRLDLINRNMGLMISKGTAATNPTRPNLVRNANVYDIALAKVLVNKNIVAITDELIEDIRSNKNVCGFVTGLIEINDFTELFQQFTAQFNQWFNNEKAVLSEDETARVMDRLADQDGRIDDFRQIYYGTTNPDASLGKVGDVYIKIGG